MSKVDILVAGKLPDPAPAALASHFNAHRIGPDWDTADLADIAPFVRGLARGHHLEITRTLLERLPALEIVANFGVGYDGIDLACAAERGIVVTNTPDVLTEEVADTALGLL